MTANSSYWKKNKYTIATLFIPFLLACKMPNNTEPVLPRDQALPLFQPHMRDFECKVEATAIPHVDAEADSWFKEARALESPEVFVDNRNYPDIVRLTRQAAERHHWKAMLNLASLYIEKRDPAHGDEDAVQLVEKTMELGIPAAFDRMGTYYHNGTGVRGDATRAYAFWQRAAQMGNPQAMAFLGEKLTAGEDGIIPGYWDNIPVATKMLECALGQGYGPAAEALHYLYASPRSADGTIIGSRTKETKARALKALHTGVKLGCGECANSLSVEFSKPFDVATMIVPYIDKARGERYGLLGDELSFNPSARFPNIDKVLPLPPADLPPWNGDRDTLLAAAMGVTLPLTPAKTMMAASRTEQPHPDPHYKLRATLDQSVSTHAPFPGYWQPAPEHWREAACQVLQHTPARAYRAGEPFDTLFVHDGANCTPIEYVVWRRFDTLRHHHGAIEPLAVPGLTRVVPRRDALLTSASDRACPATGTWQPWVHVDHPMQAIVNQFWRQAWLNNGDAFPQPEADWLLALPANEVVWYLLDDTGVDIG